jgi:hypothetical protein
VTKNLRSLTSAAERPAQDVITPLAIRFSNGAEIKWRKQRRTKATTSAPEYIRPPERLWWNPPPHSVESPRMSKLLILACVIGCFHPVYTGSTEWWQTYQSQKLAQRAGFDLNCDAQQLKFVPLGDQNFEYKTVGVQGCGETATYLWNDGNLTWIENRTSAAKR